MSTFIFSSNRSYSKKESYQTEYLVYANYSMINNEINITFSNQMSFCDKISSGNLIIENLTNNARIIAQNNSMTNKKIQIIAITFDLVKCNQITFLVDDKYSSLQNSKLLNIDLNRECFTDINNVEFSNRIFNFKKN